MTEKKYSKERLEQSRKLFLEPRVGMSIDSTTNKFMYDENMTNFILSTMNVATSIEHHIMNNCTKGENEEVRIDCVNEANKLKRKSIDKFSELLTEKCGGIMYYLSDDD